MPFQGLPWTEFISCPVCFKLFNERQQRPISLGCGHTVCKSCIRNRLNDNRCPFDQTLLPTDVDKLPANFALMHLVGAAVPEQEREAVKTVSDNPKSYEQARKCIEEMAVHLKPLAENASDDDSSTCSDSSPSKSTSGSCDNRTGVNSNNNNTNITTSKCVLSRPMQRKLISLIHCQLLEEEGRSRAARIARSLGERIVSELLVLHQYPHQLSANLWAAVRTRGCQFLGPAMQEEVLKLILLALEDGSFLSRKVLVLFVVQRLESRYPQASKTAIGHVVQLLYRASCFKVLKREEESSLMQLKEEFRQYEALRREHDSQIVQIALEAGLRISPEQWSSLLYGDPAHKSHMQSIIDKHQSPQSFAQSISELMLTLQRNSDHSGLLKLQPQLEFLSNIDPSADCPAPSWENLEAIMRSLNTVMTAFVEFLSNPDHRARLESAPIQNTRYKTSMCRDFSARGTCPRGNTCTFAHSQEELERYRSRSRRNGNRGMMGVPEKTSSSLTPSESDQLRQVQLISKMKVEAVKHGNVPPGADGKAQSVVELLDPKLAAGSPPHDMNSMFSKLAMGPGQMPGMLPPQKIGPGLAGIGSCQLDPEKLPFIPPAPPMLSGTRLTFSRPGVDGPGIPNQPTVGPQTCFHPHTAGTFPHSPHMPNPHLRPQSPMVPPPGMNLPMQPLPGGPSLRPQVPDAPLMRGSTPSGTSPGPQNMPSPGDLGVNGVNPAGMTPQQQMEAASMCGGCVPCIPMQPVDGSDPRSGLQGPQMVPLAMPGGNTLEDLNTRKQQIISHLQEEPVLMETGTLGCLADSQKGFAGLKTVLSNNKRTREAMPKSVSDMFVATRSTQSLDELLNDDLLLYGMKWSSGEDSQADDINGSYDTGCDVPTRGSFPHSNTTNSICSSIAASSFCNSSQNSYGSSYAQSSSDNATTSTMTSMASVPTSSDVEFCSFPNDDTDESFIPFEQTSISRFGPISRMSKVKMSNTALVQVTADLKEDYELDSSPPQSCKRVTPVIAVTPLERPLSTSMTVPSRFSHPPTMEMLSAELPVKPTPSEIPSIWQQTPQPSYGNIARLKAGAAGAVTNNERLAYELQAIELEIALKTGKEPEPVRKIIQEAVMNSCNGQIGQYGSSNTFMSVMSNGHITDCLKNLEDGENMVSPQRAAQHIMEDFYRCWQGIKK